MSFQFSEKSISQSSPREMVQTVGPKALMVRVHRNTLSGLVFVDNDLFRDSVEQAGFVVETLGQLLQPIGECADVHIGGDGPSLVVVTPSVVLHPAAEVGEPAGFFGVDVVNAEGTLHPGSKNPSQKTRPGM